MKQQYTFSRIFSFLPVLMVTYLWFGGSSAFAGGTYGLYPDPVLTTISGTSDHCIQSPGSTTTLTVDPTANELVCSVDQGSGQNYPPTSYTYQWYADGVAISGATSATYNAPTDVSGVTTYTVEIGYTGSANWLISCAGELGPMTTSGFDVTVWDPPSTAAAGPDQVLSGTCELEATLAANAPAEGTGTWTAYTGGPPPGGTPAPEVIFTPSANNPLAVASNMDAATAYTLVWTISSGACPSSSDNVVITSGPAGPGCQNYCDPSSSSDCGNGYGVINSVSYGNAIDLVSNSSNSEANYEDFTNMVSSVSIGDNFSINVNASASLSGMACNQWDNTCIYAYIDWNGDGDFSDLNEAVNISGGFFTGTSQSFSNSVTVPAIAVPGICVPLRIILNSTNCGSPCAPSGTGQVEDYTICICNTTPPVTGADQILSACDDFTNLSANVITQGTGYWVQTSGETAVIDDIYDPNTGISGLGTGTSTFEWTVIDGGCAVLSEPIAITNNNLATTADAGNDIQLCSGFATANANAIVAPDVVGNWALVGGTATVTGGLPSTNPNQAFTISGALGDYVTLSWTITRGSCTTTDEMTITIIDNVTPSNAGPDQSVCYSSFANGSAVLGANAPLTGFGSWTVTGNSTGGTLTDPNNPNSSVTGINATGTMTLEWTISGSGCTPSTTVMTITAANCPPDEPCVAAQIPVNNLTCSYNTYNNTGMTVSTGMAEPSCDEINGGDIWFSAVVPASGQVQVGAQGLGGFDPMVSIYDGSCSALSFAGCVDGGGTNVFPLTYAGSPGSTIYIRVNEHSSGDAAFGSFNLCAYTATTATISEVPPGETTTVTCGSTLNFYDPGGAGGTTSTNTSQPPPIGNYTNNTGTTWEICPSEPDEYVQVTFNEFTVETGFDKLVVLSGDDIIAQWTGNEGQGDVVTSQNPGECLTFYFQSDYIWTAEGWEALVECVNSPVAPQITDQCNVRNCTGGCGVWICESGIYDTEAGAGAGVDEINEVTGGCWGAAGEVATSWFYFTVLNDGSLEFEFVPSNNGHDLNFALYGPSTDGVPPCPLSEGDAPIRFSIYYAGGINTGLQAGQTDLYDEQIGGNGFAAPVNVLAGETYALVVDVYQNGKPPTRTEIEFANALLDCAVLPIDLADFSGINQGDQNLLSWIVESQRNNDYFTVYRSVDGYHWEEVGVVDGAGTTNHPMYYTLVDNEPHIPVTYYRLKQTDTDGRFRFSDAIAISTHKSMDDELITDLYPNPTSNYATFHYSGNDLKTPLNVKMYNMNGQLVQEVEYQNVTKNMPATLLTGNLSNGLYQVYFTQGTRIVTKRLAIMR